MVVHVEAICQFEEANHRRSGGCSDMIAVNMVSARGLIEHEEIPCGGMQSRAAARTQPSATGMIPAVQTSGGPSTAH